MTDAPLVYIVILNWNGYKDTICCVESCKKLRYQNYRILIVDNGSTDGSVEAFRSSFSDVEIFQTGKNLGYAGGNNAGIAHALAHGTDYVWILNNDTIVAPDSLTVLVEYVVKHEDAGIVGSKIFYYDNPEVVWYAGGSLEMTRGSAGHEGLGHHDNGQYDVVKDVDYITGCSLMIRSSVVNAIGAFDERFFLLFEDADWSVRVRTAGYRTVYIPHSIVWHKVSQSLGEYSPTYYYYLSRNSLLLIRKHNPWSLPIACLFRLKEIIAFLIRKQYLVARFSARGVLDFIEGRFGRMR